MEHWYFLARSVVYTLCWRKTASGVIDGNEGKGTKIHSLRPAGITLWFCHYHLRPFIVDNCRKCTFVAVMLVPGRMRHRGWYVTVTNSRGLYTTTLCPDTHKDLTRAQRWTKAEQIIIIHCNVFAWAWMKSEKLANLKIAIFRRGPRGSSPFKLDWVELLHEAIQWALYDFMDRPVQYVWF